MILEQIFIVLVQLVKIATLLSCGFVIIKTLISGKLLEFLRGAHQDSHGNNSWMRLLSSFVILSAVILMWHQYETDKVVNIELILGLIGLGLGSKAIQKFAETKSTTSDPEEDTQETKKLTDITQI